MTLHLVNSHPDAESSIVVPGRSVNLGPRATGLMSGSVILSSLHVAYGQSDIRHHQELPELDHTISCHGAVASLRSVERLRPETDEVSHEISGSYLTFYKEASANDHERGIYEIEIPANTTSSILGYLKFLIDPTWARLTPDWCRVDGVPPGDQRFVGVYCALEHGAYNNACYVFLRENSTGTGSIVVGGPLQAYTTVRPNQKEFTAADWLSPFPTGGVFEVWIVYNQRGYALPFTPADTPVVEVWTRRVGVDAVPVVHTLGAPSTVIPVNSLGEFPTLGQSTNNARSGTSQTARLIFGTAGAAGDILRILDWAIYPSFELAVKNGKPTPGFSLSILPDTPYRYKASDARTLTEAQGLWKPEGESPQEDFHYSPGRKSIPQSLELHRTTPSCPLVRQEPRLAECVEGASFEVHMESLLASPDTVIAGTLGSGYSIEDGQKLVRTELLWTVNGPAVGVEKVPDPLDVVSGYHVAVSAGLPLRTDWRSLKLFRTVIDRVRDKLALYADEEKIIDIALSTASLPTSTESRFSLGFLKDGQANILRTAIVNYLARYLAWEGSDDLLPTSSPAVFALEESGSGSSVVTDGVLKITKEAFATSGSKRFYYKDQDLAIDKGAQLDFRCRVGLVRDVSGVIFKPNTDSGAGVNLHVGGKIVQLRFVDCGPIYGKRVGIVPGSGSIDDIIQQTELGKANSAYVDWTETTSYRLVYRAYSAIELWVGSVVNRPAIVIPWVNSSESFDIPEDPDIFHRVAFGHFSADTGSETYWEYLRWGSSNGFNVEVKQLLQEYPSYLFGGKAILRSEFDE